MRPWLLLVCLVPTLAPICAQADDAAPATAAPPEHAAEAPPAPQLTVLPLKADCLSDDERDSLDDMLLHEIAGHHHYEVMALSEINVMLSVEKMRDIAGCDHISCYTELTQALGAHYLVTGTVRELDGRLTFSLTLLDAARNTVASRSRVTYSADEYFYPYAIHDAVEALFAFEHPGVKPRPYGPEPLIGIANPSTSAHRPARVTTQAGPTRRYSRIGPVAACRVMFLLTGDASVCARDPRRPRMP